jgi:carboxyl-terminal processing protease
VVTIIGMIAGAKFVDTNSQPVKPDTSISNANYSGRQVEEIIRFLETKYVGDISSDELVEKAIKAIMEGLDPHTHYFPPDQVDELEEKTMGHYVGIGVEIMFIEDSLIVLYPKKNSPAEKAGIRPGDYILSINDTRIPGDSLTEQEVIDLIKGSKGSRLKLTIKPMLEKTIKNIEIVRDEIKVPSVIAAYMIDSSTAFIRISRFTNSTYREFMDEWERLATKEKAKHLILDLRENPGGYLREAVNILSQLFEEEGKMLVYTEGKNHHRNEYKSTGKVFFPVENVSVLINHNSASASEIIAGCLQDQDRGLVIGSRSYGKGLVQEQYELSNGATLRLTVSKYYTPSGRLIQRAYDENSVVDTTEIFKTASGRLVRAGGGIEPDIKVDDDIEWSHPSVRQLMDIISEYAIRYNLIHHEGEIISVERIDEVKKEIPARDIIINELVTLIKKRSKEKSNDLITYLQSHKDKIYRIAESTLVAYRTGEEGWYRSFNATDPVVNKAKVLVKENLATALVEQ